MDANSTASRPLALTLVVLMTSGLALAAESDPGSRLLSKPTESDQPTADEALERYHKALRAIEDDLELIEQDLRDEAAFEAWQNELMCQLLESSKPTVRLWAAELFDAQRLEGIPAVCPGAEIDSVAVRRAALDTDGRNPVIALRVYQEHCSKQESVSWSDCDLILASLQANDPDNAAILLLPLLDVQTPRAVAESSERGRQDPSDAGRILIRAAGAKRFDPYWVTGIGGVYEAVEDYASAHPPPDPSPALLGILDDAGVRYPTRVEANMIMVHGVALARPDPTYFILLEHCKAARDAGALDTVEACSRLGRLMDEMGRTRFDADIGFSLQTKMRRPAFTDTLSEDPERWRRQWRALLRACERPRLLMEPYRPGTRPHDHLRQFYRDWEMHGEREANRRAAIREFAASPELYPVNPAHCARAEGLLEEDQRALVELDAMIPANGSDHWRSEALEGLAMMLADYPERTAGASVDQAQ